MEQKTISIPGWKIVRVIGKGGFGYVYEVEKEDAFSGGIHSALKVISIPDSHSEVADLRMEGYDDQSMTELFRSRVEDITSEFRLMNKLKGCSNIVSFEDYSIIQHDGDPGYDVMIRMELLTSLPEYIFRHYDKTPITEKIVRKLGVDICNALELCHECSIIHRDIKPQNIFVNAYGSFKLGDFGIAKTSDHTTRATKTGTFGYMAPEVYWGKPYNAAVDIYSLGLVMYWMLNERRGPFLPLPPFVPKPSQNAEALDRRMAGEPLPAPKHGGEALKRIVLKACAFDPKDRYESPTEMKRDLERLTVETNAEEPRAETKQENTSFVADENDKTFGVSGGKPSAPEETPVQEDEKTFGVFGGKSSTPEEPQVRDDEKTFGVFGGKSPTPEEPQVADDEKTFGVFGGRPTPPKETPVPESPKKPEPIRVEAAASGTEKKATVPVEEAEKTFGVFGGKPSTPEEPPVEEDEKTFGVFGARQPKEPEPVPEDDEATVSVKEPAQAKSATKPVEPKTEAKPVEPKKETKPVEPKKETKPVEPKKETKPIEPKKETKPVEPKKETKPVEKKQQKKKSKLGLILGVAAALVIAAVVLIVVLAGKGNSPSQSAERPADESNSSTSESEYLLTAAPESTSNTTAAPSIAGTYNVTVWVSDLAVDLTREQIENFNKTNKDGIKINATIDSVSETYSADEMMVDISGGADIYCFAQDQFARLFQGGALDRLDDATAKTVRTENDAGSVAAATSGGALYAYPMTSDNGYFMYYDKSVIPDADVDSLEKLIADCEAANMWFSFDIQNSAWYSASWFFATGCVSEWTTDEAGEFIAVRDTYNSENGLIAVKGMKKLLDSWVFSSYSGGDGFSNYSAIVVSGMWDYETVKGILGDNMGVTDLPSFEVDGKEYHLGSFNGCKLMGVKPQEDVVRAAALHRLAQFLTDEDRQMERFNELSWGPSNLNAQQSDAVQANPGLAALLKQNEYSIPQGQIHGAWWDIAKVIGDDVKAAKDDAGLQAALDNYYNKIAALFTITEEEKNAWGAIGDICGTMWDTDFPMTEVKPGVFETEPLVLYAGNQFKVRQGGSWDVNFGANGRDGENCVVEADGTYKVRFEEATGRITLVKVN